MKICIVVSTYYSNISKMLLDGAVLKLKKKNFLKVNIINVPGTFEIPVVISNLINKYDAFIVLGCVIRGETPHFDYLCSSVFYSLTNLSISSKKPIGNAILTCNNKKTGSFKSRSKQKKQRWRCCVSCYYITKHH